MFKNNLVYEIKLLIRSNWLVVLLVSIVLLFAFATFNGNKNVAKRLNDITRVEEDLRKKDSSMLATLAKIKNGEDTGMPYWKLPSEPMTIGYRNPRLAIMRPENLSFLATGQSDMYTHFKSPTVYGNNFALDYSEMVNPVQLLFGNFDLAFVFIYILPLLIIAFTFNVLSKEKKLGTLRLLGAQPMSIMRWLLQKMVIRYLVFTGATIGVLLITIGVFSASGFQEMGNLLGLLLLVSVYILFWFIVAFVVNVKINDSSKNALTLIGIWLLVVLVFPATINQMSNSLYPTPSRLKMINEIRLIKKENEAKQNEILDAYLRDHPELAQENDKQKFGFWHNYFASEKVMEEKTKPLLAEYDLQLEKQQHFINMFKYISPAILMQQSLNTIAGTSEKHYNSYKKQVFQFSDEWRNYLVPMLFKGEKFSKENYDQLPQFTYKNTVENDVLIHALIILILSLIIFFKGADKNLKDKSTQVVTT